MTNINNDSTRLPGPDWSGLASPGVGAAPQSPTASTAGHAAANEPKTRAPEVPESGPCRSGDQPQDVLEGAAAVRGAMRPSTAASVDFAAIANSYRYRSEGEEAVDGDEDASGAECRSEDGPLLGATGGGRTLRGLRRGRVSRFSPSARWGRDRASDASGQKPTRPRDTAVARQRQGAACIPLERSTARRLVDSQAKDTSRRLAPAPDPVLASAHGRGRAGLQRRLSPRKQREPWVPPTDRLDLLESPTPAVRHQPARRHQVAQDAGLVAAYIGGAPGSFSRVSNRRGHRILLDISASERALASLMTSEGGSRAGPRTARVRRLEAQLVGLHEELRGLAEKATAEVGGGLLELADVLREHA